MRVLIYKKGDSKVCGNYRRIILLNSDLKLFEQILDDKVLKLLNNIFPEAQSVFKKGRNA